jgi:hypothetical protein
VALRMFFTYGLSSRTQLTYPAVGHQEKELHIVSTSSLEEPNRVDHSPYRPPHLRKMETSNMKEKKAQNPQSFSDHESSTVYFTSSDSDYSDSDVLVKDSDTVQNSKVRVAAIVCIQVSSLHHFFLFSFILFFFGYVFKDQIGIVAYRTDSPPLPQYPPSSFRLNPISPPFGGAEVPLDNKYNILYLDVLLSC